MGLMTPSTRMWIATAADAELTPTSTESASANAPTQRDTVRNAVLAIARTDGDMRHHVACPQKMIDGSPAPFQAAEGRRNGKQEVWKPPPGLYDPRKSRIHRGRQQADSAHEGHLQVGYY